jgi:hypothetical protein
MIYEMLNNQSSAPDYTVGRAVNWQHSQGCTGCISAAYWSSMKTSQLRLKRVHLKPPDETP